MLSVCITTLWPFSVNPLTNHPKGDTFRKNFGGRKFLRTPRKMPIDNTVEGEEKFGCQYFSPFPNMFCTISVKFNPFLHISSLTH